MPFLPFDLGVSFLKLNIKKKGTLVIEGLLGNLGLASGLPPSRGPRAAE